jgi:hypothetical protein
VNELTDLLIALALCFAPIWLLLNANRVTSVMAAARQAAFKRAWRVYMTTLTRCPEPVRTWIYAYHGKRAMRALGRERQ